MTNKCIEAIAFLILTSNLVDIVSYDPPWFVAHVLGAGALNLFHNLQYRPETRSV